MDLPQGLDTPMDETLFSKGQLQLLAIARAVVSNPSILLLDEISANLDTKTEKSIQPRSNGDFHFSSTFAKHGFNSNH